MVGRLTRLNPAEPFAWRGWSLDGLRRVAVACLAGKRFPTKQYRAVEQWVVFRRDDSGQVEPEFVPPPAGRAG